MNWKITRWRTFFLFYLCNLLRNVLKCKYLQLLKFWECHTWIITQKSVDFSKRVNQQLSETLNGVPRTTSDGKLNFRQRRKYFQDCNSRISNQFATEERSIKSREHFVKNPEGNLNKSSKVKQKRGKKSRSINSVVPNTSLARNLCWLPKHQLLAIFNDEVYASNRVFNEKLTLRGRYNEVLWTEAKTRFFFRLTAAQQKYCHTSACTCGGETTTDATERKRGERESIQFNNKDVHLNKRINEAKNSMKCDAIHRTLDFVPTHFRGWSFRFALRKKDRSSLWCNAT